MGFLNLVVNRFPWASIVLGLMLFFGTGAKGEATQRVFGVGNAQLFGALFFLIGSAILAHKWIKRNETPVVH